MGLDLLNPLLSVFSFSLPVSYLKHFTFEDKFFLMLFSYHWHGLPLLWFDSNHALHISTCPAHLNHKSLIWSTVLYISVNCDYILFSSTPLHMFLDHNSLSSFCIVITQSHFIQLLLIFKLLKIENVIVA